MYLYFLFQSKMENQLKVYDYINFIISLADNPEDYKDCNFAILCDKYPIQLNHNNYLAKVMYISFKTDKTIWRVYPDKIKEYDIEHIVLSTNTRRRLNYKMNEFFVNGSNIEQKYEEYSYYNYSIELASKKTKTMIEELRKRYELDTPELFIGEHQPLVLE